MVLQKVEILYIILDVSKERGTVREKGVLQIHNTAYISSQAAKPGSCICGTMCLTFSRHPGD